MLLTKCLIDYENHQRNMKTLAVASTLPNYLCLLREFVRWIEAEQIDPPRAPVASDLTQMLFVCSIDHLAVRVPKKTFMVRAAVRSFCKYLIRMKRLDADITKEVEMPDVEMSKRVGPPEETIDLLLSTVETMKTLEHKRQVYRAVLYLLVFVGLRCKEISELRVEDIDTDLRQVFVRLGKGNKQRYVKAPEEFWPVMGAYLKQRPANPSDRLLVYSPTMEIGYKSIGPILAKILEAAGLAEQPITPHCLRHSFAVRGAMNGAPVPIISAQLGHSNPATTFIYLRTPQVVNAEQAVAFGRKSLPVAPLVETPKPAPVPAKAAKPERAPDRVAERSRLAAREARFVRVVRRVA